MPHAQPGRPVGDLWWRPTWESNPESNGFAGRRTTVVKWAKLRSPCTRQESNLRSRLRTPASYPLDHGGLRRMQDSNLRGVLTPTTVFGTVALPGSANPPCRDARSDVRESNAVTPDPKSGGVASAPHIRSTGVSPSDTPTSAPARTRTWDLRIRNAALCPPELQGRGGDECTPPPALTLAAFSATGASFEKGLLLSRFTLKWAASSTGGRSRTPWTRFWRPFRFPSSPIKNCFSRSKRRSRPDRFPDGRLPGITHAMAS